MSPDAPAPEVVAHPPRPVEVASIERELTLLWKAPPSSDGRRPTVTRACMSNLLIFCNDQDEANRVTDELDEIVRLHPSRVLLLVGDRKAERAGIEAYVSVHCHLAGGLGQVCTEQITIAASGDAVRRLPSTARSLLVGDLPTSLWWAGLEAPPLGGELFDELQAMTEQVIYSSLTWADPVRATSAISGWAPEAESAGVKIADLAWRRLKPWRSLIAQSLDPVAVPGALDAISLVTIEHGAHGSPQAWLLVGWLASRLGWRLAGRAARPGLEGGWTYQSAHRRVDVRTRPLAGDDPEVRTVAISWNAGGRAATMTFASNTPGKLEVSAEGVEIQPRVLIAPHQSRARLVGIQLQDLDFDPLFREALEVARGLAGTLDSS